MRPFRCQSAASARARARASNRFVLDSRIENPTHGWGVVLFEIIYAREHEVNGRLNRAVRRGFSSLFLLSFSSRSRDPPVISESPDIRSHQSRVVDPIGVARHEIGTHNGRGWDTSRHKDKRMTL